MDEPIRLGRRWSRRPPRAQALRLGEGAVAGLLFLLLLQAVLDFSVADPAFWARFGRVLLRGLQGTLFYTALVIPLGLGVGFLWGWARVSRFRALAWPTTLLVELLRGIPPIVLVIFAFLFGSALVPAQADALRTGLLAAAVALGLHTAAYQAEIFRAGFQSVPRGQMEASLAIGMTGGQTMAAVVLPQALRLALPPLSNEWATVTKDTALLGTIGATELFAIGLQFSQQAPLLGQLGWVFAVWTAVAAVYFVITFGLTRALGSVENRLRVPGLEGLTA